MLGLLVACFLPFTAIASETVAEFEERAQAKYEVLTRDFESNPYFKSASINADRDGIPSPFIQKLYGEKFNNASPFTGDVLSRILDFHMPPYKVFRLAYLGYSNLLRQQTQRIKKKGILTLVNFDEPIRSRRIYVFDLKNNRVLFNTFVSHGNRSDQDFDGIPEHFSNEMGSNESSLGFFLTGIRPGPSSHFRYMTPVEGIDGELNQSAVRRAILIHEWKPLDIDTLGNASPVLALFGATEGCFGLPAFDSGKFYGLPDRPLNDLIIDAIVGGSLVFAYSSVIDLESTSLYLHPSE